MMFGGKKTAKNIPVLYAWLPLAVVITTMSALVYATTQQNYRQSANDPQIQMAEDSATVLAGGAAPNSVVPPAKVDLNRSLATYLIIFDQNGHPVAASAELDGQIPAPPAGVFDYARTHGENRLTWQPRPGVRQAAVVRPIGGLGTGFVLAGRSLGEVERREAALGQMVLVGWLAAMAVTLVKTLWLAKTTKFE